MLNCIFLSFENILYANNVLQKKYFNCFHKMVLFFVVDRIFLSNGNLIPIPGAPKVSTGIKRIGRAGTDIHAGEGHFQRVRRTDTLSQNTTECVHPDEGGQVLVVPRTGR